MDGYLNKGRLTRSRKFVRAYQSSEALVNYVTDDLTFLISSWRVTKHGTSPDKQMEKFHDNLNIVGTRWSGDRISRDCCAHVLHEVTERYSSQRVNTRYCRCKIYIHMLDSIESSSSTTNSANDIVLDLCARLCSPFKTDRLDKRNIAQLL